MGETSVGHLGILGRIALKRSIALRAIPFVAAIGIASAVGCAVGPATPTPAGGPPRVPHSLEGREGRCLTCHEQGVAGAPKINAAHLGRTSDMCTLCHIQGTVNAGHEAGPSVAPPAVAAGAAATPAAQAATGNAGPGSIQNGQDVYGKFCNGCHPSGKAGVGPTLIGKSDAAITAAVRQGKGSMPPFAAGQISNAQLADISAYVTSLK